MEINYRIKSDELKDKLNKFWTLSGEKLQLIGKEYDNAKGAPVFTVNGKYTNRGWTEWTRGFQYGSAVLQFDATEDHSFLETAKQDILNEMAIHISHIGVHDHGFNNLSTYGNLLRLMNEGKVPFNEWEHNFYTLALKLSGAVQASRWTGTSDGGFIYSFNGPHSLFVDTIRSCRILMVSDLLGHVLYGENDQRISLKERAFQHIMSTAKYSVFYGEGRDGYDVWGRTAHESIFNVVDGNFRCPGTQQGYSGFSTWTRGLAWAMLGFSEELELLKAFNDIGTKEIEEAMLKAATATCDFYIDHTPLDGIPYWDTGAPNLHFMGDYLGKKSDPFNPYEPIDSSAAAIGAQGLLRLGSYLEVKGESDKAQKYIQAGLTVTNTLLDEPYLSTDSNHQGILLHSVYHWPNRWDHVPDKMKVACNESSMWGDYHARELALYLQRKIKNETEYTFWGCVKKINFE